MIDNDGIQDFFVITNPMQKGRDWDAATPECDTSIGSCFALEDTPFSLIKVGKSSNEFYPFNGVEVTDDFFIDNNPIEMKGIDSTDMHVADFNGDGVFDIFTAENLNIGGDRTGPDRLFDYRGTSTFGAQSTRLAESTMQPGCHIHPDLKEIQRLLSYRQTAKTITTFPVE